MKTKTLVIIVSVQAIVLLILSGLLIYHNLPKKVNYTPNWGAPIKPKRTFEENFLDEIEAYNGAIKNVGPIHDEEDAKEAALEIWAKTFSDETMIKSTLMVKYYDAQQCWFVSANNNGRLITDTEKDYTISDDDKTVKTRCVLITKDGEVLAVY